MLETKNFRHDARMWISLVLMLSVMLAIFFFSGQTGRKSDTTANTVAGALGIQPNGNTRPDEVPLLFNFSLRKWAHIGLFAAHGATVALFFMALLVQRTKRDALLAGVLSLLTCTAYAVFDEVHQYFVPGRFGAIKDILIDGIGFVVAIPITILIWVGISKLYARRQNKDRT